MADILKDIDSIVDGTTKTTKEVKVSKVLDMPQISGTANYAELAKLMKTTNLYAVKNTSNKDLILDWDLSLMPKELESDFKKYLTDKYIQFGLDKLTNETVLVAVYINGRTINFLHNYMNDIQVPFITRVYQSGEAVIKSQLIIPAKETVICTEQQLESLNRFRKSRIEIEDGKFSDWSGFLAVKLLDKDNLNKVKYSIVTVEDLKKCQFSSSKEDNRAEKGGRNSKFIDSDDLSDL